MAGIIGELTEIVPTVFRKASNQQVNELFKQDSRSTGIVVIEKDEPIGLVTRTNFYQKLGSLYGYNLYINKSIELLMNSSILVVDYTTSIIDVSRQAMQRKEEELYDYVIVTKYGKFIGVVSISRLLLKFAEIQAEMATYSNPLTGLPGNHVIEEQLKEALLTEAYTVLYIDLDNFKVYNDLFGFTKGDHVIQVTASLLEKIIKGNNGFLGHIGGDDFLAILPHYNYEACCSAIINEFEQQHVSFYPAKYLLQKYIVGDDRFGVKRKFPLISISIAVVTNQDQRYLSAEEVVTYATQIKKLCKNTPGNCYIDSIC